MADMVTSLRSRDLIDRHLDAADRRRLVLSLTPAGKELLDRCRSAVSDLEAEMLSGLSAAEASALRAGILSCREALRGAETGQRQSSR